MKKVLNLVIITVLIVSNLSATANIEKTIVKKEVLYDGDVCTVRVSADCDRDGIAEITSIVDCEHADAMVEAMQEFCGQ